MVHFVIGLILGALISWWSMAYILNYLMDKDWRNKNKREA